MRKIYTYNTDTTSIVQNSQTLLPTACSEAFGVSKHQVFSTDKLINNHMNTEVFSNFKINKMKKFLFSLFVAMMCSIGALNAQISTTGSGVPSIPLVACDTAHEFTVNIGVGLNPCTGVTMTYTMPLGMEYVSVSGTNTQDPGFTITRTGGPNNAPQFTMSDLVTFSVVTIKIKAKATCEVVGFARYNTPTNSIQVSSSCGTQNLTTSGYNIKFAKLNIPLGTGGVSPTTSYANVGEAFSRVVTITNGADGYVAGFWAEDKHGTGVVLDSIVLLGANINMPIITHGDTQGVYLYVPALTNAEKLLVGALPGNVFDTDTIFEKDERVKFKFYYRFLSCTDPNSTYYTHWGCNPTQDCDSTGDVRNAFTLAKNGGPGMTISEKRILPLLLDQQPTFCDTGFAVLMFRNTGNQVDAGSGYAKDLKPQIFYNNTYDPRYIDTTGNAEMFNFSFFTSGSNAPYSTIFTGGMHAVGPDAMPNGYYQLDFSNITSDPDGPRGLQDLDGDGFYDDLAHGDTLFVLVHISSLICKPDPITCPNDFYTPWYRKLLAADAEYKNQCGVDVNSHTGDNGYGSVNLRMIVTLELQGATNAISPTDMVNNQVDSFVFRDFGLYYNANVMWGFRGKTQNLHWRETNRWILSSGISVNPGSMARLSGLSGGISSPDAPTLIKQYWNWVEVDGPGDVDTVYIIGLDTIAYGQWVLDLKYECPPTPCVTGVPTPNIRYDHWYEPTCTFNGTAMCNIPIDCNFNISFVPHCGCPCDGWVTAGMTLERASFGYLDASYTIKANRNTPGITLDACYTLDTMLLTTSGYVGGPTTYNNGHLELKYTKPGTINILQFAGGTATLLDKSTGNSASVAMPYPTISTVGSVVTFDFDFTPYLGVSPSSLVRFDVGDSIASFVKFMIRESNDIPKGGGPPLRLESFRARWYGLDATNTQRSCNDFGDYMRIQQPANYRGGYNFTPGIVQGCNLFGGDFGPVDRNSAPGSQNLFPNEFRPIMEIDSAVFTFTREITSNDPGSFYTVSGSGTMVAVQRAPNVLVYKRASGGPLQLPDFTAWGWYFNPNFVNSRYYNDGSTLGVNSTFYGRDRIYAGDSVREVTWLGPNVTLGSPTPAHWTFSKPRDTITPDNPTILGAVNPVYWDITITNLHGTQDIPFEWLAFESVSGNVNVTRVQDVTNPGSPIDLNFGSYGTGKDTVIIENIVHGLSKRIRVWATFSGCSKDSLIVKASWDCKRLNTLPELVPYTVHKRKLYVVPVGTTLSVVPVTEPSTPQNSCTPVPYEVEVTNAGLAAAYNVVFSMFVPASGGVEIVPGTSQALYLPQSGSYLSIPDPVKIGSRYYWYISTAPAFASTLGGSPGLNPQDSFPRNRIRLRFDLATDSTCDFVSGSQFRLRVTANNPCGSAAQPFQVTTQPFRLVNAPTTANVYSTNLSGRSTVINPCISGAKDTITFQVVNIGPGNTGASDKVNVYLPDGFTMTAGSYDCIGGVNCFSPTVPTTTTFPGKTRYTWPMPVGIPPGGQMNFSIGVDITANALLCGENSYELQTTVEFADTCGTKICNLQAQTGYKDSSFIISKPDINIITISTVSYPNPPSGEAVTIAQMLIWNEGDLFSGTDSVTFSFYHDVDFSGTYTAGDFFLHDYVYHGPLDAGDSALLTTMFNVPAGRGCPMVVKITKGTCLCDSSSYVSITNVPFKAGGVDTFTCSGVGVPIGYDPVIGYTYIWSPFTYLNDRTLSKPTFTRVNNGTTNVYDTLYVTSNRGGGCVSTDTVIVTTYPAKSVGSADRSVCPGVAATFTVTTNAGSSIVWRNLPALDSFNNTSSITVSSLTSKQFEVTTVSTLGCIAKDTVRLNIFPKPTANARGLDTIRCTNEFVVLGGSPVVTGGTPDYTYAWTPAAGLTPSATIPFPQARPTSDQNYTLIVTDANGCKDTDVVAIVVRQSPVVDAGTDKILCAGGAALLGGSPTVGAGCTPSCTWAWTPIATLNDPNITNPTASPTTTTEYTIRVFNAVTGCMDSDKVVVSYFALPATANAGNDTVICSGDPAKLGVTALPGYTYTWSPTTGLSSSTIANPIATVFGNTTYTVTARDSNGCTATDMVTVFATDPINANAGSDQRQCNNNTFTLAGNNPSPGTGLWTVLSGAGASVATPTSATSTATVPVGITAQFIWTITNGPCVRRDTVQIINDAIATTATIVLDTIKQCNTSSFSVTGNTPMQAELVYGVY
jgi:hypothetical protein